MERPLLFSRLLQFSIVLSFLLPFFFVGCEKSEESVTAADTVAVADTMQIVSSGSTTNSSDSTTVKTSEVKDSSQSVITDTTEEDKEESDFSKDLIREYEWLRPFLVPDNDKVYTGLGLVLNVFRQSIFYNIFFSFLLILICLSIKFLEKSAIRTQVFLNLLAAFFLYVYIPSLSADRLWGFWVCLSLLILTIALDAYRLILTHKKKLY